MTPKEFLFVILSLAMCISAVSARRVRRIVNGIEISNIPYQVSIRTHNVHDCGGTIIHERYILTAAHCMLMYNGQPEPSTNKVLIGTNDKDNEDAEKIYYVVDVRSHEDYNPEGNVKNDIAIVKLDRNITFNKYQSPLSMPSNETPVGTTVTASGWGSTAFLAMWQDQYPRYVQMFSPKIISNDECQKKYPDIEITDGHICAWGGGHSGICTHDSGGPLAHFVGDGNPPYLVGIASFNEYCKLDYPDVYTRVYHYVPWIQKTIAQLSSQPDSIFDIRK